MKRKLAILLCSASILASCGVYTEYKTQETTDADAAQTNLPGWREYFSDPMLQELIDTALVHNTSLAIAGIRLRQADESLKASKLAYIPSVFFSPNGGISVNGQHQTSYSYQLPVSLEWSLGAPGTLFARRHQAQAKQLQAIDNMNAIRNEIISQIAASYYMLQMLDEQAGILSNTIEKWAESLEIQQELMESGKVFYSSVAQMESKLLDARNALAQTQADICTLERTICLLTAQPYTSVKRSDTGQYPEPEILSTGVYVNQLKTRPDVRAAERDLEITYYLTSEARSAFYPSIKLSGDLGWPALVKSALSLVQPIFAQGTLKCRLNISKMDEEIARLQFNQTLLEAATEVSQALADYRLYKEKQDIFSHQETIQAKAYVIVDDLSRNGKANYLEVIKAQEKLLDAQIDRSTSHYKAQEAIIMLFKALGI